MWQCAPYQKGKRPGEACRGVTCVPAGFAGASLYLLTNRTQHPSVEAGKGRQDSLHEVGPDSHFQVLPPSNFYSSVRSLSTYLEIALRACMPHAWVWHQCQETSVESSSGTASVSPSQSGSAAGTELGVIAARPHAQHCMEPPVQERDGAHAEGKSHFESSGRKMSRDAGLMSGQVSTWGGRSVERHVFGSEAGEQGSWASRA